MRRLLVLVLCLTAFAAGALAAVAGLRDERVTETARSAPERVAERVRDRAAGTAAVAQARCPASADASCREVRGRVVALESVDPDGDGDLHVVIAGGGITAPGMTSIDVRPGLRPERDPQIGDAVSAAGPVQRGSFGQAQVHALAFRSAR